MTQRMLVFTAAVLLAGGSVPAFGQNAPAWHGLGFLTIDGGIQPTSTSASSSVTYKVYGEDAVLSTDYETKAVPVIGARGGIRVWRSLTIGAGVSLITDDGSAGITAKLPHPFFFQRPREIEGTADGIKRDEAVVYAEIGWLVPVGRKMDLMVFAGPAFFKVTQEAATKPQYTESYPFDTATFTGVETVTKSQRATGATVGVDFTYRFTKSIGAGALIRYSLATASIEPVPGQSFEIDLGGLQTSLGVRIRF